MKDGQTVGTAPLLIVAGGLATLGIGALLWGTRSGETDALDHGVLRRVRRHQNKVAERVARVATSVGSPEASMMAATAISAWQAWRQPPLRKRSAVEALASTAAAVAAQRTVKALVDRRRPPGGWKPGSIESSFPSGHAAATAALMFATAHMLRRTRGNSSWLLASVWASVTAGVGVSRLYLDEHWPTDVLAGTAIGVAAAALVGAAAARPRK